MIVAAALIAIVCNGPVLSVAVEVVARMRSLAPGMEVPAATVARMTLEMRAVGPAPRPSGVTDPGLVPEGDPFSADHMAGHVVLVGYGRVGSTVADAIARAGVQFVVVEEQERIVAGLRARGDRAILGDATRADVLARAGIAHARLLVVTAPEPIRARRIIEVARAANPGVTAAIRTHSAAEQGYFEEMLAAAAAPGLAVYAEREAALSLAHFALRSFGRSDDEADGVLADLRREPTRPTEMFQAISRP